MQRPKQISIYAQACLEALSASGHGQWLSLGGAFGLAHYFEYRATHDVDAWWIDAATSEQRQQVIRTLEEVLRAFGTVHTRTWGDVVSVELRQGSKKVFSFQIARRSAQLTEPVVSPWASIYLDTFDELVASKMAALVERGAPRDFRDIYMLCLNGYVTGARCWELWQQRQQTASEDAGLERARVAVRTHLCRIVQSRPLAQIAHDTERADAEKTRTWFKQEFLHGLA